MVLQSGTVRGRSWEFDLVATCSYHESVKAVERVGVKKLKNNLSAYLRRVKRGVRVLVTDRGEVIAELGRPGTDEPGELPPLFAEWIRRGELRPRRRSKRPLPVSPVRLPAGTAQRILDLDRGE
jgi:antitoxin (DNA-binding transcriptional repressor) of toxin-antitoxin stability system